MRQRLLLGAVVWSWILPCTALADPEIFLGPPPIFNTLDSDDNGSFYASDYCGQGTNGSGTEAPGDFYIDPDEAPYGHWPGNCGLTCESYNAFASWYYQNCLLDEFGTLSLYPIKMNEAPLYLQDDVTSAWGIPLEPLDIRGVLVPADGMDALRYIPVDAPKSGRLPVAAARYLIRIEGTDSRENTWDTTPGAMFWITAIYDPMVFDVRLVTSTRTTVTCPMRPGWYEDGYPVQSGVPLPFLAVDHAFGTFDAPPYLETIFLTHPDWVVVRLKEGYRLEDLGGRQVLLMVHSLSWIGDDPNGIHIGYCGRIPGFYPPLGDKFHWSCTSKVMVGADLEGQLGDWSIQPSELKDECVPPSFAKADDKSAEADIIGTRLIKDLNAEPPAMRVGKAKCKVGRSLSDTLACDAVLHTFWDGLAINEDGEAGDGKSLLSMNMHGVPCTAKDLPGWQVQDLTQPWSFSPWIPDIFAVKDPDTKLAYVYGCEDMSDLAWVPDAVADHQCFSAVFKYKLSFIAPYDNLGVCADEQVRQFTYATVDPGDGRPEVWMLTGQEDCVDGEPSGNQIEYQYNTTGNTQLTIVGTGVEGRGTSTRTISATYQPSPNPRYAGSRRLLSCAGAAGGPARQYEWYPNATPATAYDGKLKTIKDGAGEVLAGLEYDNRARLIKRTRGTPAQTVAEYIYSPFPAQGQPQVTTMDARFYVDDDPASGRYQLIRYTFNMQGQVIESKQYHDLQSAGSETGATSVTAFDYCTPPSTLSVDDINETNDLFYQDYGGAAIGRCVIKALPPRNPNDGPEQRIAEYTRYNASKGFNPIERFLGPPQSTASGSPKVEPSAADLRSWMAWDYVLAGAIWQKQWEIDKSRSTNLPDRNNAKTNYSYDFKGFPTGIERLAVTYDDSTRTVPAFHQTRDYVTGNPRRIDQETRDGPTGTVTTTYGPYDDFDNFLSKTESAPGATGVMGYDNIAPLRLTWDYTYNAFGQKILEVDPDIFAHQTDYDSGTGLLAGTCLFDPFDPSEDVIQQTKYTYEDGLLKTISQANHDGPFPLDFPAAWIVTTYHYDTYGRLSEKIIGSYHTYYKYDRQDRLVTVIWPDGRWKHMVRDGRGQIRKICYGRGATQDENHALLTSTYNYDGTGNLTERLTESCPECGKCTEYEYDRYNRRTAEIRREVAQ